MFIRIEEKDKSEIFKNLWHSVGYYFLRCKITNNFWNTQIYKKVFLIFAKFDTSAAETGTKSPCQFASKRAQKGNRIRGATEAQRRHYRGILDFVTQNLL
jgi:hypothetical protein